MVNERGSNGAVAPTTNIETLVVVRPLKVIAVMLGGMAMLLLFLSIAGTSWLEANRVTEGLWEKCLYRENSTTEVDCDTNLPRETDWLKACRALCLVALIVTFFAILVTSIGLRNDDPRKKYRFYVAGMVIFFIAVGIQLMALVTFPVKFLEEIEERVQAHWTFGWAYGLGWVAAIMDFIAGLLVLVDKNADEIVYREITNKKEGWEEEQEDV